MTVVVQVLCDVLRTLSVSRLQSTDGRSSSVDFPLPLIEHHLSPVLGIHVQIVVNLVFAQTLVDLGPFLVDFAIVNVFMVQRASVADIAHLVFQVRLMPSPLFGPAHVMCTGVSLCLIEVTDV